MATAAPTTSTPTGQSGRNRPWIVQLYGTALGKKYAMAISGIVGLGYIFAHMVGNLKMYFGAESFDTYSEWLREGLLYPILPHTVMLWILRLSLIAALVVHVHAAYALTVMNRRARGTNYQSRRDYVAADFAARTMRWTGVIVLLFIGYHLADLTWGVEAVNPAWERGDAYANLVASLSRPAVAAFYLVANLALGVHIYHGIWSMFQTMGWNNRTFNSYRRALAVGFTVVVIGGNLSFPIAVQLGIVG
ncbi:succinate dehydrogenase cytochrome b subunit [Salsipaludibacter albus]|uniref:succinate dehydrogenase cytochrome b subunit n=1 Tax=Salsipaludibacter albus TaxID=2849650 RepID=UPI001EE45B4C|nr:succinate dehydrogenase cytochrome b subunit [Salsipaludibacter albus]MBY5161863.1 succinate dehydrogenase cytochrome b subunit [Salsipaludibacter albus]